MRKRRKKRWACGIVELTPDQVQTARDNGLHYTIVWKRIGQLGWDIEKAVTEPSNKVTDRYTMEDRLEAEANGIIFATLRSRLQAGWDLQRAKTQPTMKKKSKGE